VRRDDGGGLQQSTSEVGRPSERRTPHNTMGEGSCQRLQTTQCDGTMGVGYSSQHRKWVGLQSAAHPTTQWEKGAVNTYRPLSAMRRCRWGTAIEGVSGWVNTIVLCAYGLSVATWPLGHWSQPSTATPTTTTAKRSLFPPNDSNHNGGATSLPLLTAPSPPAPHLCLAHMLSDA
jgi:hypothetical protein